MSATLFCLWRLPEEGTRLSSTWGWVALGLWTAALLYLTPENAINPPKTLLKNLPDSPPSVWKSSSHKTSSRKTHSLKKKSSPENFFFSLSEKLLSKTPPESLSPKPLLLFLSSPPKIPPNELALSPYILRFGGFAATAAAGVAATAVAGVAAAAVAAAVMAVAAVAAVEAAIAAAIAAVEAVAAVEAAIAAALAAAVLGPN